MALIFVYINILIFIKQNLTQVGLHLNFKILTYAGFVLHFWQVWWLSILTLYWSVLPPSSSVEAIYQYAVQKPKRPETAQQLLWKPEILYLTSLPLKYKGK